jgi:uncharacterized protein YidB (DUF937 family)
MSNDFMGQILGRVLGGARLGEPAPPAGGGGLGDVLGSVLGGAARPGGQPAPGEGHRGMLMALLLPLALQWVQRNGGIGSVLDRFRQQGYGAQANSWVSTGSNQRLGADEVGAVVGGDELSRMAQQLGVDRQQVAGGLAEILPQVVHQVTPNGHVPPDADHVLNDGRMSLEQALEEMRAH